MLPILPFLETNFAFFGDLWIWDTFRRTDVANFAFTSLETLDLWVWDLTDEVRAQSRYKVRSYELVNPTFKISLF